MIWQSCETFPCGSSPSVCTSDKPDTANGQCIKASANQRGRRSLSSSTVIRVGPFQGPLTVHSPGRCLNLLFLRPSLCQLPEEPL